MKAEVVYQVIKSLTGEIDPIGETHVDTKRLENLKNTIKIADMLIYDIAHVSRFIGQYQASMKEAGKAAQVYLDDLKQSIIDEDD